MSIKEGHGDNDLNVFFIRDTDTGAASVFHRAASQR